MELAEELRCLFSAQIENRNGSYVVDVPKQEVELGDIREGEHYRVAILPSPATNEPTEPDPEPAPDRSDQPPVEEGETRDVEIEGMGDQGDGIARVERGFVIIVPDTDRGERVTVEITDVRETVAFATVVDRLSYYD